MSCATLTNVPVTGASRESREISKWLKRTTGQSITRDDHYANPWEAEIDEVKRGYGEEPAVLARSNAKQLLRVLEDRGLEPSRLVASGEGGVAFVFEEQGRYADIECLNDGAVLAGFTDFKAKNEVVEIELGMKDAVGDVVERIRRWLGPR